jgi:hypothetical protein
VSLNELATKILPQRKAMTEREWVTFLYQLRGYTPPETLFDGAKIKV